MLDIENGLQQEALGIVGVNLVYGACFLNEPARKSSWSRCSTDSPPIASKSTSSSSPAPSSTHIDNRVMSLRLVQLGLTGAAMFAADGEVLQPAEVLYKKPVLIERGRFRPVTHVNLDLARSALRAFEAEWPDDVDAWGDGLHHGDHHEQPDERAAKWISATSSGAQKCSPPPGTR